MTIADDGIGGARSRLPGMYDRVAAQGGTLAIERPPGRGHADRRGAAMRIVIAEDTVLLREGLAGLLEDAGHEVVGKAGDADTLLVLVAEHEPELAVVDVRMPPGYDDEGTRAASTIRPRIPARPCSCSPSTSRRATSSSW